MTGDPSPHTLNLTGLNPTLIRHFFRSHTQRPRAHRGTDAAITVTRSHQYQVTPRWQLIRREEQPVVTFLR
jgi:hypothetical protein